MEYLYLVGCAEKYKIRRTAFVAYAIWWTDLPPPARDLGVSWRPAISKYFYLDNKFIIAEVGVGISHLWSMISVKNTNTIDLTIAWAMPAVFDTAVFLMTVFKRFQNISVLKGGILSVLLRDGTIPITWLCNRANLIFHITGTLYYG